MSAKRQRWGRADLARRSHFLWTGEAAAIVLFSLLFINYTRNKRFASSLHLKFRSADGSLCAFVPPAIRTTMQNQSPDELALSALDP